MTAHYAFSQFPPRSMDPPLLPPGCSPYPPTALSPHRALSVWMTPPTLSLHTHPGPPPTLGLHPLFRISFLPRSAPLFRNPTHLGLYSCPGPPSFLDLHLSVQDPLPSWVCSDHPGTPSHPKSTTLAQDPSSRLWLQWQSVSPTACALRCGPGTLASELATLGFLPSASQSWLWWGPTVRLLVKPHFVTSGPSIPATGPSRASPLMGAGPLALSSLTPTHLLSFLPA